jgi:hypothetical protein
MSQWFPGRFKKSRAWSLRVGRPWKFTFVNTILELTGLASSLASLGINANTSYF